jgi:GR25 family glycosyltransferase involved in LPS biosynthesis
VSVRFFCVHHTDLESRKRRLVRRFAELGLEVEWIETHHPRDSASWDDVGPTTATPAELSVAFKHREALRRQVSRAIELAVVLEDDVDLPDDFRALLDGWLDEFRSLEGDLLMIGTCFGIRAPETVPGRNVYCGPGFRTRCLHAYAATLEAARAIVPELDRIPKAVDHHLNDILSRRGLRVCYVEPGVEQLTQKGELLSAIKTGRTLRHRLGVLKRRLAHAIRP